MFINLNSMKKQFFLTIIVICTFCLTALSAYAGASNDRKLTAYPNPIDKGAVLTVEMPSGEYGELTVILYNTVGKAVYTLKTTNKTIEFNVPEISGIYFLRIVEKTKVIDVEKIVVKE